MVVVQSVSPLPSRGPATRVFADAWKVTSPLGTVTAEHRATQPHGLFYAPFKLRLVLQSARTGQFHQDRRRDPQEAVAVGPTVRVK